MAQNQIVLCSESKRACSNHKANGISYPVARHKTQGDDSDNMENVVRL